MKGVTKKTPEDFFDIGKWKKELKRLNTELEAGGLFADEKRMKQVRDLSGNVRMESDSKGLIDTSQQYSTILKMMAKMVQETGTLNHEIEISEGNSINL
jgi:hypothetical protein